MALNRDYANWLRRAVRRVAARERPDRLALWDFPESDFAAWCCMVKRPAVGCYADYLQLLRQVERDQRRLGRKTVRVHCTVARMRDELRARAWPNNARRRAAVIALLAAEGRGDVGE